MSSTGAFINAFFISIISSPKESKRKPKLYKHSYIQKLTLSYIRNKQFFWSTFSILFSSSRAIMARRAFINFPAQEMMTDFEIIYVGHDIIQHNKAIQEQNQNNSDILPIQDLHIEEDNMEGTSYVQVPNIPEDNPHNNVRHISFNMEQIDEHSQNNTLDLSLNSSNEQIDENSEEITSDLSLNSSNSSVFEKLENTHDSSGTIQDDSNNDSTPNNSNDESFKSMMESPQDNDTLNRTTESKQDEIEELHRVVHSTTKVRNNDTHFVNIFNLMSNKGPIISAVSPNFCAPYINDYFVCHLCHSDSKQNQSWNEKVPDSHPCIRTVAGMFLHLYEHHCQKQGKERQISVQCERFVEQQIACLQYGWPNPLFNTKESIPKSASTSIMDNSWKSKDSWASKGGKMQITNLRKDMKHVFDGTQCSGHSIIPMSKDTEFYDLANSIYCTCDKKKLDEKAPKLSETETSPTFSIFKALHKTQRTLFGASPIKGPPIPNLPHKTHPPSRPKTRSQTSLENAMQASSLPNLTVLPNISSAGETEGNSATTDAISGTLSRPCPPKEKGGSNQ